MTEIAFVALTAAGAIACWLLFLLPSLVAFQRRHPQRWAVFSVNLLLGATGIGWLAAFIWARQAPFRSILPLPQDGLRQRQTSRP